MAPRPASNPRPATVTRARSGRPSVRDFTGAAAIQGVEFDVRTAFDFVFSLAPDAGSTEDLPAADRRWLADARASLPDDVRDMISRLFQSDWCIQLGELVVDHPEVRTAAELVAAVERARPTDVLSCLFSELVQDHGLVVRALDGDAAATTEVESHLPRERDAWLAVLADPAETHRQVVAALRAWLEPYRQIEQRVAAIINRDVDLRAVDRRTLAVADLIEQTTGGIRWLPETRIRRVILAPSYFSRPYNFILGGPDWRLFGYPVADEALEAVDPLAPAPGVVRLHRALGDETRLRILKLLTRNDYYLTELAQLLELSKPTIKHHLALLRAAGLITAVESGAVIYYTLRRSRLDDASADLKRFLAV